MIYSKVETDEDKKQKEGVSKFKKRTFCSVYSHRLFAFSGAPFIKYCYYFVNIK